MSSIAKIGIGLVIFQMLVVVFLVGISEKYVSDHNLKLIEAGFDSDDVVNFDNLDIFDKFSYTLQGLPWYIDIITFIPSVMFIILGIVWLRGVN